MRYLLLTLGNINTAPPLELSHGREFPEAQWVNFGGGQVDLSFQNTWTLPLGVQLGTWLGPRWVNEGGQ